MRFGLLMESSAWGGAEIHAVGLVRTLIERGHETALTAPTQRAHAIHRERAADAIPLDCLDAPRPPHEMGYRDWRPLFAGRDWDVCMLIKGDIDSGGGCAIDFAARRTFANYLVLEQKDADPLGRKKSRRHFGFLPGIGLWWYGAHLRRYLRSVGPRKIVCVSDTNRKRLIAEHRFPERKMATVRNGIDVERFRRNASHRRSWREEWGIGPDALVFGAVGRLHRIKGYDIALDAFQALLAEHPAADMHLVLVGEGPEEAALRKQAGRIEPSGRVRFVPFQRGPETLLSAIDVFVMPSRNEGLPLALAEAMACECCPIATDVGGIAEAVTGDEVGWLVPTEDLERFSAAMREAAGRTAGERAAIGARAREAAVARFNAVRQYEALIGILESFQPGSNAP